MASDRDQETARAILNATVREQRATLAGSLAKARAEGAKEAQAEVARLRAVLEWAATILTADREGPGIAWRYMPDELRAAARGDWPAVRAAGVVLPGEEG